LNGLIQTVEKPAIQSFTNKSSLRFAEKARFSYSMRRKVLGGTANQQTASARSMILSLPHWARCRLAAAQRKTRFQPRLNVSSR
jgi:hypothetical protein